jgi:signal transduction histidine kinase
MIEVPSSASTSAPVACLIVDDLEENRLALSALLRRADVGVMAAASGIEALDLLLVHEVALAIVDVQMPEMDGFELAELMRGSERTRHVPLIMVTAGTHDEHRMFKGYDAGAVDFLYKPIEPHVLKNKADVFFELYRQKRQLEHELVERTEMLRVNEMFAAVLGHDLRNPLNAILTSAELLKVAHDDRMRIEIAGRIASSSRRMSRMIQDMLDLARARLAGGIPVACTAVDLGALVRRTVDEHRAAFPDRRVEIASNGDLAGTWDADRLSQLASNLIGNALVHGRAADPVEVCLDGSRPDGVTVVISNGGAIDPTTVPRIFEPFRRGDGAGGRGGLGLGLYISQQIARAHGGRIQVDPPRDDRTVFRVDLPRFAPVSAADRADPRVLDAARTFGR